MKQSILKLSILLVISSIFILNPSQTQAYTPAAGVQAGDIVDLEYEGKLSDADGGGVFDAQRIEADISPGKFIDGFYNGILGMKVGETKTITIPPEEGYNNDPSNALYGKTLIFTVFIYGIVNNINDPNSDNSGGTFSSIWNVVKWIGGFAIAGLVLFSLNSFRVAKTTSVCMHCDSLNRSNLAEGTCSKCGNAFCRKSFTKGCPDCKANSFIPYK